MDLDAAKKIAAAGMRAQARRTRIISENLANAESVASTPGGDPYRRKVVVFQNELDQATGAKLVSAQKVVEDQTPFDLKYDPNHPMADAKGYIKKPNVNPLIELMDMREAQRSYEANLNVLKTTRMLTEQTLDLLK
ncbi:MAG: flagellar basal body rod protein FlgC [Alphaproteobacteria bacterium]